MSDVTIPADAPRNAATVEEFVERMRQSAAAELVERLSTAQRQVQAALLTMAHNATMLNEEDLAVLEGLSWAEYNLGVLAERAEEGNIMDVSDDDDELRAMWDMCHAEKEDER